MLGLGEVMVMIIYLNTPTSPPRLSFANSESPKVVHESGFRRALEFGEEAAKDGSGGTAFDISFTTL